MTNKPSLLLALLPIVFLITLLALNISVFADDALAGSNQFILLLTAAVAGLLSLKVGLSWEDIQDGIVRSIATALPAVLILLLVGSVTGMWMLSGIIPAIIYYGLDILTPGIFLAASCIVCCLVSIATGSSWATTATIGVALMGIGQAMQISPGMTAGAVISGAYFGDKISPLSDTTSLAAAASGTELFTHIRYMLYTTIPSISISVILFALLGINQSESLLPDNIDLIQQAIRNTFYIHPILFVVPLVTIILIVKRMPAIPALLVGIILGAIFALIFQPDLVAGVAEADRLTFISAFTGLMQTAYGQIQITSGNAVMDELLTAKGMAGMLNTIWLILAAMTFGGVMEAAGFLQRIMDAIMQQVRSVFSLIAATAITCGFFNITTSDQYLSIVVPGRMYRMIYKEKGLAPQNLSRTLEDSGTVTSVLVPWNTCGAFQTGVLGVATLTYLPFCFFNIISPFMTLFYAFFQIKIKFIEKPTDSTVTT